MLFFALYVSFSTFSVGGRESISCSGGPGPGIPSSLPVINRVLVLSCSAASPFSVHGLGTMITLVRFGEGYARWEGGRASVFLLY